MFVTPSSDVLVEKKDGACSMQTQPVESHVWFHNGTVMPPSLSNMNLLHIAHNRDVCDPFRPISWKSKFHPSHRSRLYLSRLNTEEELVCMFQRWQFFQSHFKKHEILQQKIHILCLIEVQQKALPESSNKSPAELKRWNNKNYRI